MVEHSSTEYNLPNIHLNLNDQQFRLNKTSEVRDSFIGTNEQKT